MKVVLDTNVLISGIISPRSHPARVLALWEQGTFDVCASETILAEYERVIQYPHLGILPQQAESVMRKLRSDVIQVSITEDISGITRDRDDDKFLACAIAGGASYIVSGDEHLAELPDYRGILILPPALFVAAVSQ